MALINCPECKNEVSDTVKNVLIADSKIKEISQRKYQL